MINHNLWIIDAKSTFGLDPDALLQLCITNCMERMKKIKNYLWSLGMNDVQMKYKKGDPRAHVVLIANSFANVDNEFRQIWVKRKLEEQFGEDFISSLIVTIECKDAEGN